MKQAWLPSLPSLPLASSGWLFPAATRLVAGAGRTVALGAALLALFYLPYIRHQQFGATYTYLVDRRIAGDGFPVNNVADLWLRLTTYSSSYYGMTLIALLTSALDALPPRPWDAGAHG